MRSKNFGLKPSYREIKLSSRIIRPYGSKKRLATTCSPTVLTAVPSALEVLTTEFGMGSGVAPPLWLPAGKCWEENLVMKDKIARPNLVELVTCVLIIFFR